MSNVLRAYVPYEKKEFERPSFDNIESKYGYAGFSGTYINPAKKMARKKNVRFIKTIANQTSCWMILIF